MKAKLLFLYWIFFSISIVFFFSFLIFETTSQIPDVVSPECPACIFEACGECLSDGCNGNCPPFCTVDEDPDCGCRDGDGCCGIGCDFTSDNDCPIICTPDGCNGSCPVGCTVDEDPDCGCRDGDGCCGIGCDSSNDSDCPVAPSVVIGPCPACIFEACGEVPPVCFPDGCNRYCPVGCTVDEDPDCGCRDGDGCCGIGCNWSNDSDCPPPEPLEGVCVDVFDVVFIMDTSDTMDEEFGALCGRISEMVNEIGGYGYTLNYQILGCGDSTQDCATQSVVDYVSSVGGVPVSSSGVSGSDEDWGPGTEDIARYYQWTEGSARIIIPMSDECPDNGDPCDDADDRSINGFSRAIDTAIANRVRVYPIVCSGMPSNGEDLANDLASGTDGTVYYSTDPASDLTNTIVSIITSTWDADGDGFITIDCPCNPNNLPPGIRGCWDCDDTNPIIIHQCFYGGLVPCGKKADNPDTAIDETAPCTLCHVYVLFKRIIDEIMVPYVSLFAILMTVVGGIILQTASGDPGRISQGKKILKAAIIGLAIALMAWLIVSAIIVFLTPAGSPFQAWHTIDCPVP